ncbi:hypothetical protein [Rhodococcoides trifolii]|nr:hypothetical protein [Rhodococcus trifolii]
MNKIDQTHNGEKRSRGADLRSTAIRAVVVALGLGARVASDRGPDTG